MCMYVSTKMCIFMTDRILTDARNLQNTDRKPMSDQTSVSDRCSVNIVHRLEFCQYKCSPRNM